MAETTDDKVYFSHDQLETSLYSLADDIAASDFDPDYVVGIARGGNVPATYLSHQLERPYRGIVASYYEGMEAQDQVSVLTDIPDDIEGDILLVDEISDTGQTMERIYGEVTEHHDDVTVRTATIHVKPHTDHRPDYYVEETDQWVVYPWEKPFRDEHRQQTAGTDPIPTGAGQE